MTRTRNERGQILILTAVTMVMVLSMAALALDASYMYDKRNELHAAADAAAKVAAIELRRDSSLSNATLKVFADEQVKALGLTPAACGATSGAAVCITKCPPTGPFSSAAIGTACNSFVEAIVSQQTATFFARLLGLTSMTPRARAVAGVSPGPNCIVVFDHVWIKSPASGPNASEIHMDDCSLIINGEGSPSYDLDNRGDIYAKTVGVVHTATGCNTGHVCTYNDNGVATAVSTGVAPATDPLATLPPLPRPTGATCTGPLNIVANFTMLQANINDYYCGFNIKGSGGGTAVTFETGKTFFINGPVTDSGGSDIRLVGTDVMLFLSNTATLGFNSSNNVTIDMTAASSGTYNGILFYQDRTTPKPRSAIFGKNNTFLKARGAFYFPTVTVEMQNENSQTLTNPCMVIVAWAIEVDRPNFQLNNSCLGYSGSPLMSLSLVE